MHQRLHPAHAANVCWVVLSLPCYFRLRSATSNPKAPIPSSVMLLGSGRSARAKTGMAVDIRTAIESSARMGRLLLKKLIID